jgi:hypothetical protein
MRLFRLDRLNGGYIPQPRLEMRQNALAEGDFHVPRDM